MALPEGVTKRIIAEIVDGQWQIRFRHEGNENIISPIDLTRLTQAIKSAHRGYLYEEKLKLKGVKK